LEFSRHTASPATNRILSSNYGAIFADDYRVRISLFEFQIDRSTTLTSNENQLTNVASKLEEMDSKIEQLMNSLRNEPSHHRPVTTKSDHLDLKHQRVMDQLQHCVLSAKTFVSNASSSLSSGSSIFEYDHMSDSKRKAVEDWARLTSPEDLPDDLVLRKTVSAIVETKEIRCEDDSDLRLDFQVIQNWRHVAAIRFRAGEYAEAEALLRQVWEKSTEKYDTDYYWRDSTMAKLVKSCMVQEKWDEAEEVLMQILDEQTRRENTSEAAETRHKLAEVYLGKDDLENAQYHCQQALNIRKRELGETDKSVRDSIQLLVQIFETKNDEISAAGYRPLLRDENWNQERNALQELSWMRAGEASTRIGVDYFEDLLPEDDEWKWEKIKKNIRRRSTGFCGAGYGYTLLHALVEFGPDDAVQCVIEIERRNRLVEIDPFVDVKDNQGNTPLHLAAEGRLEITRLLIENGADVNEKTNDGRTPLIIATKGRSIEIVQLLLDHGADVTAQDELEWSALHYAMFVGAGEVAEVLIETGADVEIKGASGRTPLHCAAVHGREDIVRLLLEKGANFKAKCSEDKTPLELAERKKNERVARILRSYYTHTRRKRGSH